MGKVETAEEAGNQFPGSVEELGNRLRELEKGFANRAAAAKAAGVAKSTFQNWVEGKADPSFKGLARFARDAGVSLDWIAYGDEGAQSSGEKEVAPLDADVLQGAIEAVRQELEGRKVQLPPDKQAVLISEIYAHLREEKLHGPQNADHIIRLIRSMVKVAS